MWEPLWTAEPHTDWDKVSAAPITEERWLLKMRRGIPTSRWGKRQASFRKEQKRCAWLRVAGKGRQGRVQSHVSVSTPPNWRCCYAQELEPTWEMQCPEGEHRELAEGAPSWSPTPSLAQGHQDRNTLNAICVMMNWGSAGAVVVWPGSFLTQIIWLLSTLAILVPTQRMFQHIAEVQTQQCNTLHRSGAKGTGLETWFIKPSHLGIHVPNTQTV